MKKYIYLFIALVLIVAAGASFYAYSHYCKQQLREVDRYALPDVVKFMEALSEWNLEALKPFLSDKYINSLTEEEWQSEFETLSVLGELESFARPNFISHTPFKKYKFCKSAIDMYSVASEFEKDNAVVRIFFNNNCGKLKVRSFIVTSPSVIVNPEYLESSDDNQSGEVDIEPLTEAELEGDLDSMYESHQEDSELFDQDDEPRKKMQKPIEKSNPKAHGKSYRY